MLHQQGVGTIIAANERLIGGRALLELFKINKLIIITNIFLESKRTCRKELISTLDHLGN
jgi:hypothetical protein